MGNEMWRAPTPPRPAAMFHLPSGWIFKEKKAMECLSGHCVSGGGGDFNDFPSNSDAFVRLSPSFSLGVS